MEGRKIGRRVFCPYCRTWLKGVEYRCRNCGHEVRHITEKMAVHPDDKMDYCFIATAAYGTPFANDINVLRRWRDSFLVPNINWAVKLYYKASPPIARLISKSNILKALTRFLLYPLIFVLKKNYHANKKYS